MDMISFLSDFDNFLHVLPILIAGAFASVIFIERTRALFKVYPLKDTNGFFNKISELVLMGKTNDAVALCDQYSEKPISNVAKAALTRAHLPEGMIEHGIEYAVGEETHKIQKRTAFLATIANVATLLGLFGTIAGLISSFKALEFADPQQRSQLLAAGIATAMNATMIGLGVAIPAMVAFSFLMNKSNKLIADLENQSIRMMELLKQRYYASENLEFQDNWAEGENNGKVVQMRRAA